MVTIKDFTLDTLLANYKSTSDEEIQDLLRKILLVNLSHNGIGTVYGYRKLDTEEFLKLYKKPRGYAITFFEFNGNIVEGLTPFKRFPFYIKSSSRFVLKPDYGEVFDQMTYADKMKTKAIHVHINDYELVDNTQGEDFIMWATLLK